MEAVIKAHGFRPIENLTGHSLAQYNLHAGIDVPNIRTPHSHTLKEGDFLAIEPFATTGAGRVGEGTKVEIYSLLSQRLLRGRESRRLQAHVASNYRTLPFAERWLYPSFKSKLLLNAALRELILSEALHQYPILKEAKGGLVSQAEVTVVVEKDSARVLTK